MKKIFILFCILSLAYTCFAQEPAPIEQPSSGELINKSWEAHGRKDIEATLKYTQQCIDLYKDKADAQEASLITLPDTPEKIKLVPELNDVTTAYFIQGESYRSQGKNTESIQAFKTILEKYCFGQAWDPRGWYWSIAKASRESILGLNPAEVLPAPCAGTEPLPPPPIPRAPTKIVLSEPGTEDIVDYKKYGQFQNAGTKDYKYVIKDQKGLINAVGEGIYPNTSSVKQDPEYKKAKEDGRLTGKHWDFVYSPDLEAAFLKWGTAPEPTGVKLYYTAILLEKSGLLTQALKAYYAIVVHFPGSYGWTYWHTPWYMGQAAISRINFILRNHPELGLKLEGAHIKIINGFDNDVGNDIVVTHPGKLIKLTTKTQPWDKFLNKIKMFLLNKFPKKVVGKGRVQLVQFRNGDWQLIVDKKPYVIKGVTYAPTRVGESPDDGSIKNWMQQDVNNNGKIDGPYDAFVDKNKNNIQDADEPSVGDFQLLHDMGANTIRLYHQPFELNKPLFLDLYKRYGIMVIVGDFLGKYALGSGAKWSPGTDYSNPEQQKNMLDSVTKMVMEYKDEPFVLFWLLGNENVYGVACNADKDPKAFFSFANVVAKRIKEIDKNHPVAIASGDTLYLDQFAKYAPDIDIFGANTYRGETFGYFWQQVKDELDKPAFITEYACPAYVEGKTLDEAEDIQAQFLKYNWEDIASNMANVGGLGNALGGVHFEYLDEWWKAYEPSKHDIRTLAKGPFPDGNYHEEWFGLMGQGDGSLSPFLRQIRKSYYMYKGEWRKEGK